MANFTPNFIILTQFHILITISPTTFLHAINLKLFLLKKKLKTVLD